VLSDFFYADFLKTYHRRARHSGMAAAELLLNGSSFSIDRQRLAMECRLFEKSPNLLDGPYAVKSRVSIESFHAFLCALTGRPMEVTQANH
jgi:hypothetical protein